ncbi:MAG: hypothetical protein AAB518_00415 [Patescibacteria group bacterium]
MSKQKIIYLIVGILIVVVLAIIHVVITNNTNEAPSIVSLPEVNKTQDAEQVAKKIVTSYLVSPGSAQFSSIISHEKLISEPDFFVVFGDVDSQNALGGLLRSHFFLELRLTGGSSKDLTSWQIEMFDLGGTNFFSDGKETNPPLELNQQVLDTTEKIEDLYRSLE